MLNLARDAVFDAVRVSDSVWRVCLEASASLMELGLGQVIHTKSYRTGYASADKFDFPWSNDNVDLLDMVDET